MAAFKLRRRADSSLRGAIGVSANVGVRRAGMESTATRPRLAWAPWPRRRRDRRAAHRRQPRPDQGAGRARETTSRTSASRSRTAADGVHRHLRIWQARSCSARSRRDRGGHQTRPTDASLQGFVPTQAPPDVDVLGGLTTAIIVDQEHIGANSRSTVGTATDADAMLRILFSRLAKPHIGGPGAYPSTSPPSMAAAGSPSSTATRRSPVGELQPHGRQCRRCEGRGSVTTSTWRRSTTRTSRSTRAR